MEPKFKVGQTVYLLINLRYYTGSKTRVVKAKIKCRYRNYVWKAKIDVGLLVEITHTQIGETVFFNKEDADKAFQEYLKSKGMEEKQ